MGKFKRFQPHRNIITSMKVAVALAVLGGAVLAVESPRWLLPPDEPAATITQVLSTADGPSPGIATEPPADMTAQAGARSR